MAVSDERKHEQKESDEGAILRMQGCERFCESTTQYRKGEDE